MNCDLISKAIVLLVSYREYTGDFRIANVCGEIIEELKAELAKPEQEPCGWVNELGVFSKSYPTDFVYSWKPVYASPFNITLMAGKSK